MADYNTRDLNDEEKMNAAKEEAETVSKKLQELTDEELTQITGGGRERYILLDDSFGCPHAQHGADYTTCPYKDDYTKCPDKGVTRGCKIEY